MGHIIIYSLWAVWTVVFIATGWADAWFGALGAGLVLACISMLILMLALGLFTGLALSLQDCFYRVRDMRDRLRKRFG